MDVEELYDEFGNYVGTDQSESDSDSLQLPVLPSQEKPEQSQQLAQDSNSQGEQSRQVQAQSVVVEGNNMHQTEASSRAIVLAEDKQYYPSAAEVFGPDTEVLVEEEDAQDITEPIIAPFVEPSSGLHEEEHAVPPAKYSRTYLNSVILKTPALIRNIALVGHLHHGKSSFADMLFDVSHEMPWANLDDRDLPVRYMDTRRDEQALGISVKTTASTFLLQDSREKSYGFTVLDTPGHVNFLDESIAAMALVDGVAVFVDVAEGIMMGTEVLLQKAALMRLDIVLVISKLDRLCLELRIPPDDGYHKIRYIIESANDIISSYGVPKFSPARGNVAFTSSNERVCFTLKQFARAYIASNGGVDRFPLSESQLARRLWGDVYYDPKKRKFTDKSAVRGRRSFVGFVLEPFYKLHTAVVSEDLEELTAFLQRNKLLGSEFIASSGETCGSVDRKELDSDLKTLLRAVNGNAFGMGKMSGFVEMVIEHIKSPVEASERKVAVISKIRDEFTDGSDDSSNAWRSALIDCDVSPSVPMTAYVGKLIPDEKGASFDCLVRILSGHIRLGENVRVLGDEYDKAFSREDQSIATVTGILTPCARFKIHVSEATAGQIVLLQGVDQTVFKSATIVSQRHGASAGAHSFRSMRDFLPAGSVKVAIEPIRPSELPKMVTSLQQCVKSYPGLVTKVEESGEHTMVGSGELYMDCVLRDLREAYAKVDIKVSDPVVPFAETVSETSALQCYADTPNGQNKLTMIAEPLDGSVLKSLEDGTLEKHRNSPRVLQDYGWDVLAAKSLWTFGPDTRRGPNALLNDVLVQESRRRANDVRESIVQGFCWATREGPLTDEPVRGVEVRLLDAEVAENEVGRSGAQIIPTSRRVVYSSILTASPRLVEPVYKSEIICTPEMVSAAYMLVARRRGVVVEEGEVAGSPLMRVIINMPVLDSFGFEADLRNLTHGRAMCLQMFDHWGFVPGDPLDKSVELRPLEPAGRKELARECMVKTRRRKGLGDEVSLSKYFDDPLLAELVKDDEELRQLL